MPATLQIGLAKSEHRDELGPGCHGCPGQTLLRVKESRRVLMTTPTNARMKGQQTKASLDDNLMQGALQVRQNPDHYVAEYLAEVLNLFLRFFFILAPTSFLEFLSGLCQSASLCPKSTGFLFQLVQSLHFAFFKINIFPYQKATTLFFQLLRPKPCCHLSLLWMFLSPTSIPML